MSKKRSLLLAVSGLLAAVMGVLWIRRPTRKIDDTLIAPAEPVVDVVSAPQVTDTEHFEAVRPQRLWLIPRLLLTAVGVGCFTAAQSLLMQSRAPILPAALYLIGLISLIPFLQYHANLQISSVRHEAQTATSGRGWVFAAAALFFVVASIVLAQLGRLSFALIFTWLMSIVALLATAYAGTKPRIQVDKISLQMLFDGSALFLLPVILALLMRGTFVTEIATRDHEIMLFHIDLLADGSGMDVYPNQETAPPYLYLGVLIAGESAELSDLQRLSGAFALALVPLAYLFGCALDGRWTGWLTAGFVATSGWTLALAKSGHVYAAVAAMSALYLALFFYAERTQRRRIYLLLGLALGFGWLLSPLFLWLGFLPLIAWLFRVLDRQPGRVSAFEGLFYGLLAVVIVTLPFLLLDRAFGWLPAPQIDSSFVERTGIPVLYAGLDALSSSLFLFTLSSDPSPLHLIVNRPVFMPLVAALFIVGTLAIAFRINATRRWRDTLPLVALLVALIPSALSLHVPIDYPSVWRAALALPIAIGIAAYGGAMIARTLTTAMGRIGMVLAIVLFAMSLLVIANDAHRHYMNEALPAYERAAPIYEIVPR